MLKKTLAALRDTLEDSDTGGGETGAGPGEPATDGGATQCRTRSQLFAETGLEPDAYVERLLANQDGRLRQTAVRDSARLSPSTTSRLLTEMEEAGQVVRITDGREKIVCLPDSVPESVGDHSS